jgi:nitroreductase
MTLYEAIFRRKSIRKYKEEEIPEWILNNIDKFEEDAINICPDIRVKWKIFQAEDKKVKGMFQVKAPYYLALYSEVLEGYRENAGCLMEQLSLLLHTLGIGSCYQGGAHLSHDEEDQMEMVMIMAFGYPAEPLEREKVDFKRLAMKKILKCQNPPGKLQMKLLEPARLAPSAMNQQPWHFVVTENRIHLFVKKPGRVGYRKQLDWNLFDAGITLSHMLITADDLWLDVEYQKLDSILEKDFRNYLYVGSLMILSESEKI